MNIGKAEIVYDAVHTPHPQLIITVQVNGHTLSIDMHGEELAKLLSTSPRFFGVVARVSFDNEVK